MSFPYRQLLGHRPTSPFRDRWPPDRTSDAVPGPSGGRAPDGWGAADDDVTAAADPVDRPVDGAA